MRVGLLALLALALAAPGCATRTRQPSDHYLRYVGFELPFNENVLLHWSRRQMPLRVHLPVPPSVSSERLSGPTPRDRATLRALYARPNGHRVTGPKRAD